MARHSLALEDTTPPGRVREPAVGSSGATLAPVVKVPIRSLAIHQTLRVSGEQPEHTRALAASLAHLPPIVVHRPTMHVIDGLHRIRAAELCGQEFISAYMLDGDEVDVMAFAAQLSQSDALPLSPADRKALAKRIVTLRPQWSDRLVASITSLSAKTGRKLRCPHQVNSHPLTEERVGRDGRVRPVNGAAKRQMAADLLRRNPEMSLRQVAKAVGISPETARSVQNRLRLGEEPTGAGPAAPAHPSGRAVAPVLPDTPAMTAENSRSTAQQRAATFRRLMADPSLRYNEQGRRMLHLLKAYAMTDEQWATVLKGLPAHRREVLAAVALDCARGWTKVARLLTADIPAAGG